MITKLKARHGAITAAFGRQPAEMTVVFHAGQDKEHNVTEPGQRPAMSKQNVGRPGIHRVIECDHLITRRLG